MRQHVTPIRHAANVSSVSARVRWGCGETGARTLSCRRVLSHNSAQSRLTLFRVTARGHRDPAAQCPAHASENLWHVFCRDADARLDCWNRTKLESTSVARDKRVNEMCPNETALCMFSNLNTDTRK